ncbi:MarR family transcriptional regulator for hemolysin [Bradyrhizobium sp. F1.4.3]
MTDSRTGGGAAAAADEPSAVPDNEWELLNTPAPLINMASRGLMRLAERRLKPFGASAGQLPVFYLLRDGGAMSQRDLARLARIEQPSMAQTLARMERDGLVRRVPDPKDGRSSLVSLTRKALAKMPALREALHAGRAELVEGFSEAEVATLCDLLQRLNRNLERGVTSEIAE